jgi:CheY-like chemotaxis protein
VVTLNWVRAGNGDLRVSWRESGGPPVKPPSRVGFGSTIIRRSFVYDLNGTADVRFEESGVEADFSIPKKFITFAGQHAALPGPQATDLQGEDTESTDALAGMNVLLVEDNLIIAMNGEDILRGLGAAEVIATPSVARALEVIDQRALDLGLLDVNLGDETSFAIAERLKANNIPFAFATGYGESIPQGQIYFDIPVLQKPYTSETVATLLATMAVQKRPR